MVCACLLCLFASLGTLCSVFFLFSSCCAELFFCAAATAIFCFVGLYLELGVYLLKESMTAAVHASLWVCVLCALRSVVVSSLFSSPLVCSVVLAVFSM